MPDFIIGAKRRATKPPFYTPILPGSSPLVHRLKASFPFNEGTGGVVNDATHGANHLTVVGTKIWTPAPKTGLGPTLYFDGTNYTTNPQTIYMDGLGHTVSCRVVIDSTIATLTNNWVWGLFGIGSGALRSSLFYNASYSVFNNFAGLNTTGQGFTPGVVYDIVVTSDKVTQSLYINGVLATSRANANPIQAGFYALRPGFGNAPDGTNNKPFGGWMDALHLWDRALDPSEVAQLTVAPFLPIPSVSGLRKLYPGNASRTGAAANAYTMAGPTVGGVGVLSPPFTVQTSPAFGTISGTCTITPNDGGAGGTFTPSSVIVSTSAPNATFTYTPAATGSVIVNVTNTGGLTNPASISMAVLGYAVPTGTIALTDTNLVYAPGVWRSAGGSPSAMVTNNPGAYLEGVVTGTFHLGVQYDTTPQTAAGIPAGEYPVIGVSIDNAPIQTYQLSPSLTKQGLATFGTNGTHYFRIYHLRSSQAIDRWGTVSTDPASQLRLTNLLVDSGASTLTYPLNQSKRMLFFGTSITEGIATDALGASTLWGNNALWGYAPFVADALQAEYGQIGFGGSSLQQGVAVSNIPQMYYCSAADYSPGPSHDSPIPQVGNQSWQHYDSQHSRLVSGLFSPMPDYVVLEYGTTDVNRPIATNLYDPLNVNGAFGLWPTMRAAMAPTSWLFHLIPFTSADRTILQTVAAAYALVDPYFALIDPGLDLTGGLGGGQSGLPYPDPTPSYLSYGSTHPHLYGSAKVAARIAARIQAVVAPHGSGGGHSRSLKRGR